MKNIYLFGNWKMNLNVAKTKIFATELSNLILRNNHLKDRTFFCIFPSFLMIPAAVEQLRPLGVAVGAQNVNDHVSGAYTGEVSPEMLTEAGVEYVIIGHSERRHIYGETSELVNRKALNCIAHHLIPVICVGETLEERERDKTFDVIREQLTIGIKNFPENAVYLVAYEPVWAIGTGRAANPEDAEKVCAYIKNFVNVPVLYGGSVKPANSAELFSQKSIDGGLIGGASMNAFDYISILENFRSSEQG